MSKRLAFILAVLLLIAVLASCSPSAAPTTAPSANEPSATSSAQKTTAQPTQASAPAAATSTAAGTQSQAATSVPEVTLEPKVQVEGRSIEFEWPASIRMGDSDVVRLSLIPTKIGYQATAEFEGHDIQTRPVDIPRPVGYDLYAQARLDTIGFVVSPLDEQPHLLPPGEDTSWRWTLSPRTAGKQTLSVQLLLRWVPTAGSQPVRESQAFSRSVQIEVISFLGLSPIQAASVGLVGLIIGGALCLMALILPGHSLATRSPQKTNGAQVISPSASLSLDLLPGVRLDPEEESLLRGLFGSYARLVIEREFLSGYSGARTFLVRPIRLDQCADAATIVKLGPRQAILQEWTNYEDFVSHRLPPVTARIQRAPVTVKAGRRAAVQYTFIAEPGKLPVSLRQALLNTPDPDLLLRLFETFGPSWWMQRRAYTFRLGQEYDLLLPPHLVLQPADGKTKIEIGPSTPPGALALQTGDLVRMLPFKQVEVRADQRSLTLTGSADPGRPPLRLRWLGAQPPAHEVARVVSTRAQLLVDLASPFDRFGLPDPLTSLDALLQETIAGTRSVIHGDLNLENALVGPGNLLWLIDFAQTREGHPLFDFAHLESELIAHVIAPKARSPRAYLDLWRSGTDPLLEAVHGIARRCLFDPAREREYHLALYMASLGALKYHNLGSLEKHCLYLTAADLIERAL